jgi:hypothetical protein
MAYEIILGREEKDRDKFGLKGTILIGKQYVKMGATTALAQPVYLDLNKAHVVFVCGKRGSGKSYALGVIAEGIAQLEPDLRKKLSVIIMDTMGIYWTMKYPNHKDEPLLREWGLEGKGIENVVIYTPVGFFKEWREKGIPTDKPLALNPGELGPDDWWLSFELNPNEPLGVFVERIILSLKKEHGNYFDIEDIIKAIQASDAEENIKTAAENRFRSAQTWGLFSKDATAVKDLAAAGQITVLDLSAYMALPNGWRIKHLALGIITKKLFLERMVVRKDEEYQSIHGAIHYITSEHDEPKGREMPIVWLAIDECHEFLPAQGQTAASESLITLLREGRQPGVAMVMATQQPGKIHTDAMTQSDIVLAHRLTAKIDVDALGAIMQGYFRGKLDQLLNDLPRVAGAALALDDVNERMYPMRIRPRFSWHGGGAPAIVREKKKVFEF